MSTLAVVAWLGASALAQGVETHRPIVPSSGIATENGPGALWVNPANLSYDPDLRYGLYFARRTADDLASIAATVGVDGLGVGIHNRLRPDRDEIRSDWSLDYGTSIPLPERFSLGLLLSWNFVDAGTNFLAYDAGLSWRPLPWLGLSGVAQNVGSPDPSGLALARTGGGIALRPFDRFLTLGADFSRTFATARNAEDLDTAVATLRLRPVEGLYVRGNLQSDLVDGAFGPLSVGGGIEIYMDGVGVGGHLDSDLDEEVVQAGWVGSDEPGESLLRPGRRVPILELDKAPPYQPRTGLFADDTKSWLDTLELIRRLEDDRSVRGLVLELDGVSMSMARYRELRERVLALEQADKQVLVYLSEGASNGDVYVASAASRVALHPAADLELVGLSVQLTHLRGLLDLVGVEPQYVKRSKYKSAPETFTHPEPSPANLEMQDALLDDLFGELVAGIATGRGVDEPTVRGWIDRGPLTASEALDAGVVDVLLYPDELEDELRELHQGTVSGFRLLDQPQAHSAWEDPKQIAVVYVEGAIVSGESSGGGLLSARTAGSDSIVRSLRRARHDPQVRAVVMRVDSPGGSSLASDEIWREVQQFEESGKPIVVSMGGVAASGGYYVAAAADAIWAEPETLTGSIGVFSGKFATTELQDALGVHTTLLSRGRNASIFSSSTPWDDVQRARMQALVDATYEQFKDRVAKGRELDEDAVEQVAQGRVWSGKRARENGLVDELGGFQDALSDARARAGLPASTKVGIVTFAESGSVFESLAPALATRALAKKPPTLQAMEQLDLLLDAFDPLLVPLMHPGERVWMMDPWLLEIGPR